MSKDFADVLIESLNGVWSGVIGFLPKFIVAVIVFIVGWIIAVAIGKVIAQIIRALKVDKGLQAIGLEETLSKAGFKLDAGAFLGGLVRWFFIIVFLLAAVDVLGLDAINAFLRDVLGYLPSVIVAAVVLIIGSLVAGVMQRVVVGSAKAASIPSAGFLGGVTKWSIWIFAILIALYHLGVGGVFAQTLFTGFVAMLALAGGLSFGLGGKDAATRYIEKLRKDINHND